MPITRKQISAAASTSNPPLKNSRVNSNLPVSDDDLFEQSAIQVSSATRQNRTINHQIPQEMRKQLRGVFAAAAGIGSSQENLVDSGNFRGNVKKAAPSSSQSRTLVKRSIVSKNIFTVQSSHKIEAPVEEADSIFEVPVTSSPSTPPRPVTTVKSHIEKVPEPQLIPLQSAQHVKVAALTTPRKPLTILANSPVMAEVRRTPLTMAEKKRRQSITTSKNENKQLLDKSTKTNISLLKSENVKEEVDIISEIKNETVDGAKNEKVFEIIDILGSDEPAVKETKIVESSSAAKKLAVTEKESDKSPLPRSQTKKRKIFIRTQATESAPPDISVKPVEKAAESQLKENVIDVDNLDGEVVKLDVTEVPVVTKDASEISLVIEVPPPPKLEDLETLDPELYVKLKSGSLKDDPSVPFISESDRIDIESFLESFSSPEFSKTLLPVSIIGEGTFSTVYKVIDRNFYECENSTWIEYSRQNPLDWLRLWRWVYNQEPSDQFILFRDGKRCVDRNGRSIIDGDKKKSTSKNGKLAGLLRKYLLEWATRSLDSLLPTTEVSETVLSSISPRALQSAMLRFRPHFIALKRINATSSPQRILDEISFLKHLGGRNNVVPIINGLRCEDQVLVTFPYFYSDDFREFLGSPNMTINSVACYMRCLFVSLAHLHNYGIIHRDVKPSNFLYAPENGGRAILLDFGLAQKVSNHSKSNGTSSSTARHQQSTQQHLQQQRINTTRNNEKERKKLQAVNLILNTLGGSGTVTNVDSAESSCEKMIQLTNQLGPGYFNNDPRAAMKASRAGTRGFRAPEVLFKSPNQSTALDIWSAGVIMLTLLTRRYPFFQSSDDFDAIVEIANIFGNKEMSAAAKLYSRRWLCNIPSVPEKPVPFAELCFRLNPGFFGEINEECMDLLKECLNLNSEKRITAKNALKHPFILKYAK